MAANGTARGSATPDTSAVAAGEGFGLYRASDFRVTDGRCDDCPTIPQALWYFQRETIAVPRPGQSVASFATGVSAVDDLRAWLPGRDLASSPELPPLVWVAAPDVLTGSRLDEEAKTLASAAGLFRASLVPMIALNRSYFDATSAAFFSRRRVRVRGHIDGGSMVMRTLWPEDFRLPRVPPPLALAREATQTLALRALMRAEARGGAKSEFCASTLWQRRTLHEPLPAGRAVLALMVNGAQGDDDEAHAGHFALVTGRTRDDGAIGDWLVNNFYALDSESEKGIIAAPVPLDNYLADLNSGQGWYRPSQLMVLVLANDRAAALVQAALNRVYNQFWRHQLAYRHAAMNCTGISIDVLRALGWEVPARGPAGRIAAAVGFPYVAAKERSLAKARVAFDYLTEDQTRLLPAVAFEECGADALRLAASAAADIANCGTLARLLAQDIDEVVFVRFPQFPSSRAFGDAPVVSPWEFRSRLPSDPKLLKVIPVPARPFPKVLRDPDLVAGKRPGSDYAVAAWWLVAIAGIAEMLLIIYKQWFN